MELPMAVREEDGKLLRGYRQAPLERDMPCHRTCNTKRNITWKPSVCTEFFCCELFTMFGRRRNSATRLANAIATQLIYDEAQRALIESRFYAKGSTGEDWLGRYQHGG